ncbi:MAG: hypothetical protein NPINA01_02200 [Nitrospinaceae bacterium]|nr:MAG: hypothetical protein NPINA01_02200 [Nitrospinaceae bacterium]
MISPEEEELRLKRRDLAQLEQDLADKELELSTLNGELHLFEKRYQLVVGAKYTELDEVKAQILELASRLYPRSDEFRAGARSARERAQSSAEGADDIELDLPKEEAFEPTENLKKLFREVAKKIHPDLASNDKEKARRHELMARLNQAYDRLDEEGIHAVLQDWEAGDQPEKKETLGVRLVRTVRQISQIKKRLQKIDEEMAEIKNSGMYQLMNKIATAGKIGGDILEEMAASVDEKIASIKSKVRDLAGEFD